MITSLTGMRSFVFTKVDGIVINWNTRINGLEFQIRKGLLWNMRHVAVVKILKIKWLFTCYTSTYKV